MSSREVQETNHSGTGTHLVSVIGRPERHRGRPGARNWACRVQFVAKKRHLECHTVDRALPPKLNVSKYHRSCTCNRTGIHAPL
jgi:hypothetical protein